MYVIYERLLARGPWTSQNIAAVPPSFPPWLFCFQLVPVLQHCIRACLLLSPSFTTCPSSDLLSHLQPLPSQLPCADFHCCIVNYLLGQSWSQDSKHRQRSRYVRYKAANTIVRGCLISGQNCNSVGFLHSSQIWSMLQRCLPPSLTPLQPSTQ